MEENEHIKKLCYKGTTFYVSDEGEIWRVMKGHNGLGKCGDVIKARIYYNSIYPYVSYRKENVQHRNHVYVHVLVWMAFNGERPKGMEIDHIDNDTKNFRLNNLQLLPHSENVLKGYIQGGSSYKCRSVKVSLPGTEFYQIFHSLSYAATQIGCSRSNLRIRLSQSGPEGIDVRGCHVEIYDPDKSTEPCDTRARKQRYAALKQQKPSSTSLCATSL